MNKEMNHIRSLPVKLGKLEQGMMAYNGMMLHEN